MPGSGETPAPTCLLHFATFHSLQNGLYEPLGQHELQVRIPPTAVTPWGRSSDIDRMREDLLDFGWMGYRWQGLHRRSTRGADKREL
jgi:hypothetical protein